MASRRAREAAQLSEELLCVVAKVYPTAALLCIRPSGGRAWWAHFEFTRINITPTTLRKQFEERLTERACCLDLRTAIIPISAH